MRSKWSSIETLLPSLPTQTRSTETHACLVTSYSFIAQTPIPPSNSAGMNGSASIATRNGT